MPLLKAIFNGGFFMEKIESFENQALLNEKQAAAFYGASVKTLQAWRHKRTGPHYYKIGNLVRYALGDLKAYAQSGKVKLERG
jgi:predicted DNA-binding transcriptional regulator AlpA